MEYELRPATETDREFCFRLNEACFRLRIERIRGWHEERERADCASQFRAGSDQIVLVGGQPVGHVAIEEHSEYVELRMLLLTPDTQGKGIGSSLVQKATTLASMKRLPAAVWVTDWNEAAIRFYRRLGFQVVDSRWLPEKHVRKLRMVRAVAA